MSVLHSDARERSCRRNITGVLLVHHRPGVSIMKITVGISFACLLAGATLVNAQTSVDKSFTATSNNCSGIQWSESALERYPTIASACQGVEERNGKKYVKFQGKLKSNQQGGERIVVDFKDGGEMTLTPPPETNVYIDGRRTPVAKLKRGDELNFYIAEDRLAAQFPETETATARFVAVPIVAAEEPEQEQMAAALPATASWLPMLGLGGLLGLMFASLLTLFRHLR
jgi:hypothetical protein